MVRVEWIDSAGPGDYWTSEPKATMKQLKCDSVGFVVEDKANRLTIASTLHLHQHGGVITIPRIAILRTARLKGGAE